MLTSGNIAASPLSRRLGTGVWLALCLSLLSVVMYQSEAHEGATGIVKKRMDAMSEMACAMKIIANMVKERRELDLNEVAVLGRTIASRAADIPTQFPDTADSRTGQRTEARPTIWERWPEFTSRAQRLEEEGEHLVATARTGTASAIGSQFKSLGKACRSCHKDFRKKKKGPEAASSSENDCTAVLTQLSQ